MPLDPISIAGAAGGVLPSPKDYFNLGSTIFTNRANRRFAEKMYDRQKADALEFYGIQNEYNSPRNQMARFQEANLNPFLVYGQMGNNSAANLPTPDTQSVNFREPRLEGGNPDIIGSVLAGADLRIKNAQANNLEVQTSILGYEESLRATQAERAKFDLDFERRTVGHQADFRRERVRGLSTGTDIAIREDVRREIANSQSVYESVQRVKSMIESRKAMPLDRAKTAAETRNIIRAFDLMEQDGVIKELDIELKRLGINPGSPVWSTVLGRIFSDGITGKSGFSLPSHYAAGSEEFRAIIEKIKSYFR